MKPIDSTHWNQATARHLLNRAGFGITQDRVDYLASLTPAQAVAYLVDFEAVSADLTEPDFLIPYGARAEYLKEGKDLDAAAMAKLKNEYQKAEREAVTKLQAWWVERMVYTPRPLEEKLTLFWHGHFATSAQKVKQSLATYQLNKLFRDNAAGNFKQLATEVGQSTAMLIYLDNRKSTPAHPNENWARELMELFTLGQGNYSEEDIKNSARAFTGWTTGRDGFVYNTDKHDDGTKTFMGRTGAFDGWQIMDIIFEQPATANFIAKKLWTYFAYENPEPEIIDALAQTLRAENYELRPLLRQMFTSAAFYSPQAIGTQVKSPAQLVVQLCEDLNIESPPTALLTRATKSLGQDLFFPPNVKGWDGNRDWINANTLLLRYNLPLQLTKGANAAKGRDGMKLKGMQSMEMQSMDMQAPEMQESMQADIQATQMAAAQSKKDAMEAKMAAYRKESREQVRKALAGLPRNEAKAMRLALKNAKGEERRALLKQLGVAPPPTQRFQPGELFAELKFSNGRTCVEALRQRFLVAALDVDQQKTLLTALGITDPEAPLELKQLPLEKRHAALHLLTSMAEYQLC